MSRVTALLTKRNKADGNTSGKGSKDDRRNSTATISPEKEKSAPFESRNGRTGSLVDSSTAIFNADSRNTAIKRQPSNNSISIPHTTVDGTPVVYATTAEEVQHHSNSPDDGKQHSARRSTFSRGGPALHSLTMPSAVANNASDHQNTNGTQSHYYNLKPGAAHQPVGEGSLSLDTFLQANGRDALTPKPGHTQFQHLAAAPPQPQFYVTQPSPLPEDDSYPASRRGSAAEQFPAVFENSDLGSSSSSSAASFANESHGQSRKQLERAESGSKQVPEDHRPRSYTTGLPPASLSIPSHPDPHSDSSTRGRSSSAITSPTNRPSLSVSPARSSTAPTKPAKPLRKPSNGIAGALALSGVAFASPHAGMAHPFQMSPGANGGLERISPVKKESGSSETFSANGYSNTDTRQLSPHDIPALPQPMHRSSEEGYDSPTPISNYTPHDSPRYEDDPAFNAMVSMDALGDFEGLMTQMGTGYALASSKRNADFHSVFKNVPEDDFLIEDYGCALQREILIQGRLYISEHRLCFNANIFGWVTTLIVNFHEIMAIEKRNTALVIPNAIHIATMHSRNTFASFISRDMTYDLIVSLWRNSHPVVPASAALPDSAGMEEDDDDFALSNVDERSANEGETGRKKRRMRKGRFRKQKGLSVGNGGAPENGDSIAANEDDLADAGLTTALSRSNMGVPPPIKTVHAPTQCNCLSTGSGHYSNVVMDASFPGTPEKLYNLMFTSGFMKDFLTKDMKLTDLQIGDWAPQKDGSHLLTRTYSYIKAINAPVGPKSTKCILIDENLHVDFDDFVINLTTTKTPEVPSGGSFAVKTKTCFTWGRNNTTRVLVTTAVEWTGRSFIKGIVDRSSLDGQKTLYVALDTCIRSYISAHRSEFYTSGEGEDEDVHQGIEESGHRRDPSTGSLSGDASDSAGGSKDVGNKPGEPLSFIANTVPYSRPFCDFVTTLYDTLADVVGQMSASSLVCAFIIIVLFISNVFTLRTLHKSSSRSHSYLPRETVSRSGSKVLQVQDDVAAAVRNALKDYFTHEAKRDAAGAGAASADVQHSTYEGSNVQAKEIWTTIDTLEAKIKALKSSLKDVD